MKQRLYASGYTDARILGGRGATGNPGIRVYDVGTDGRLSLVSEQGASENPSFLAVLPGRVLAACEQIGTGHVDGYVKSGGELKRAASLPVPGTSMCHICIWPDGRFASVSNYTTGELAVVALENGLPKALVCMVRHRGVGFDKGGRQEGPHVHSTAVGPDGEYLYAADLGLDRVFVYRIDRATGKLRRAPAALQIRTDPGQGPRHFCFSPDGRFLYVDTEMGGRVYTYEKDAETGAFRQIRNLSVLPEGFAGANTTADVRLSPNGRVLYVSNRGADTIACLSRDAESGQLSPLCDFRLDGAGPRNFALDRAGRRMAVACQSSGDLLLYAVGENGVPAGLLAREKIPQISFVTFEEEV